MAVAASPMLTAVAPGRPRHLPTSITKGKTGVPPPKPKTHQNASIQSSYQWTSVQKIRDEPYVNKRGGVFVTTLCMDIQNSIFAGAEPRMARLEKANFDALQGGAIWCYVVGGKCVVIKGVVAGKVEQGRSSTARDLLIARLPEGLRPMRTLVFAVFARDTIDDGEGASSVTSSLATVVVTTNGEIIKLSSGGTPQNILDLSGIRFCTDRGISLVDEVSVHAVDVAGSRLVTLQGVLLERNWGKTTDKKQLATLPESCRPAKDIFFVAPGMVREGFHLVHVRSVNTSGTGGEIMWRDTIWRRDRINLTGVFFEAAPQAVALQIQGTEQQQLVARQALLQELLRRLVTRYGSVDEGLRSAFNIKEQEELNFTQFAAGVKNLGYYGTMMRLWGILDEDQSGEVSFEEIRDSFNVLPMNSPKGSMLVDELDDDLDLPALTASPPKEQDSPHAPAL